MSRIKSNAALTVIDVVQGMGRSILGYDLLRFPIQRRRKTIIELLATMPIDGIDVEFRVLGFWHKKDRVYRWYITNLNCSRGLIYDLYRLRWQLELSFKSMKSHLNFDRIPTTNQNTVSVFILVIRITKSSRTVPTNVIGSEFCLKTLLTKGGQMKNITRGSIKKLKKMARLKEYSSISDRLMAVVFTKKDGR